MMMSRAVSVTCHNLTLPLPAPPHTAQDQVLSPRGGVCLVLSAVVANVGGS
jgi:hypothetical protein